MEMIMIYLPHVLVLQSTRQTERVGMITFVDGPLSMVVPQFCKQFSPDMEWHATKLILWWWCILIRLWLVVNIVVPNYKMDDWLQICVRCTIFNASAETRGPSSETYWLSKWVENVASTVTFFWLVYFFSAYFLRHADPDAISITLLNNDLFCCFVPWYPTNPTFAWHRKVIAPLAPTLKNHRL